MWQLLRLLQMPREWAGSELAERLGASRRSVSRDVARLRSIGYPIDLGTSPGWYRLESASGVRLVLTDAQADSLAVALAAAGPDDDDDDADGPAVGPMMHLLPAHLRARIRALQLSTQWMPDATSRVDPSALTALALAIHEHELVRFTYRDHSAHQSLRQVEPYRLIAGGGRWYLFSWDLEREQWRTFRVDRMIARASGGGQFIPRAVPAQNLAVYTSRGVSSSVYRYQARVWMHAPALEMAARIGPRAGTVEAIDEENCMLRTGANSLDDLAGYIAKLGVGFDIVGPKELIEHIHALGGRLSAVRYIPEAS